MQFFSHIASFIVLLFHLMPCHLHAFQMSLCSLQNIHIPKEEIRSLSSQLMDSSIDDYEDRNQHESIPSSMLLSDDRMNENTDSTRQLTLEQLLSPISNCDVNQLGPTTWAYVGDVILELLVRTHMIWPPRRTSDLQTQVVSLVRGKLRDNLSISFTRSDDYICS